MSLESNVTHILRHAPVGRICFKVEHISVNRAEMELVAKAIENKDVAVELGSSGSALGASYGTWKTRKQVAGKKRLIGKITLDNASVFKSKVGKAGVFHESVHALMDVKNLKLNKHNHEVIAYVADAIYQKMTNAKVSGGEPEMAIFNAAFAIIKKHDMLKKRGVDLKWSDCDDLRDAIKAHKAYQ